GAPGTIEAELVNGTSVDWGFELIDVPSWLTPSASTGTVLAGQELDLVFAIDPALPRGGHMATLNAAVPDAANAQFLIPLEVQVDIVCQPPTWAFSPSDYEHTMTAIFDLRIDALPADTTDVLAAFVGGQVRGLASPRLTLVDGSEEPLIFMTIHSNRRSGENVRFQVFDTDNCRVYGSTDNFLAF
ncbi:MAG: hypothetical protein GY773_27925, partial [Actinomycetia bacterium]|nr:hypothetical protein [Actinomycetes bacterium]